MLLAIAAYWVLLMGESMLPAYRQGYTYEYKRFDRHTEPRRLERGDVIVLRQSTRFGAIALQVKRIVGVPGDTLKAHGLTVPARFYRAPVIQAERFYVTGDNFRVSRDSRHFGTIHRSQIVGRLKEQKE